MAIGFNTKFLTKTIENMPYSHHNFSLNKVIYNGDSQEKIVLDILEKYYVKINECKNKSMQEGITIHTWPLEQVGVNDIRSGKIDYKEPTNLYLSQCAIDLIVLSFIMKNDAFYEEDEYRICFYPEFSAMNNVKDQLKPLTISDKLFRLTDEKIVPYYTLNFDFCQDFISEIVLGPKCRSDESVIRDFLKSEGFKKSKVVRSIASYQ